MTPGVDEREGNEGGGAGDPAAWGRVFGQLFDPHPSHVALVGLDGTILAVNAAWRRYASANGNRADYAFVGRNYLAECEAGVAAGYPSAAEAYVGLLGVLRNGRPKFTLVYPCHGPAGREWYRMWVEPQTPSVAAVIVAHQLVAAEPWAVGDARSGPTAWPAPASGTTDAARPLPLPLP